MTAIANVEVWLDIIQRLGIWVLGIVASIFVGRMLIEWQRTRQTNEARDTDWLLARSQVGFATLLLVAIVSLVFVLVLFKTQLSETGTTILTSVIAALVAILTLQMNFFYARSRPTALPDPNGPPPPTAPVLKATFGDPNALSASASATPSARSAV